MRLLLNHHARADITNLNGQTAAELAKERLDGGGGESDQCYHALRAILRLLEERGTSHKRQREREDENDEGGRAPDEVKRPRRSGV